MPLPTASPTVDIKLFFICQFSIKKKVYPVLTYNEMKYVLTYPLDIFISSSVNFPIMPFVQLSFEVLEITDLSL